MQTPYLQVVRSNLSMKQLELRNCAIISIQKYHEVCNISRPYKATCTQISKICAYSTKSFYVLYMLFNGQIDFSPIPQVVYIGWLIGLVGSQGVVGVTHPNDLKWSLAVLKMLQKVVKSIHSIMWKVTAQLFFINIHRSQLKTTRELRDV